jgi:hypothetical protein
VETVADLVVVGSPLLASAMGTRAQTGGKQLIDDNHLCGYQKIRHQYNSWD